VTATAACPTHRIASDTPAFLKTFRPPLVTQGFFGDENRAARSSRLYRRAPARALKDKAGALPGR